MEFDRLLKKVVEEPDEKDCNLLFLKANSFERLKMLFETASKLRDDSCGRKIKLDSFIYPVKKCLLEKYCIYCSNFVERFRLEALNLEEFLEALDFIKSCGMKRVTLEGGYNRDKTGIRDFIKLAKGAGLEVTLDFYPIEKEELRDFRDLGVSEIYSSIEIADEELFRYFKPSESLENRLKLAKEICDEKIGLSSTILIGLPKTDCRIWIRGLFILREMENLVHCSISGFQPVNGTPLQKCETTSIATVAKFVSIARLVLPEKDISACGSAGSVDSLPLMLIAGANRAYLGAYVCRARTEKGFADELDEVFRPSYESTIERGLVFADPSGAVEKVCREMGFEID